jgi:EmrB/QacA subfamily drug resistance transporter
MLPMFMGIMDQTIVATALPAIAATLGSIESLPWVVAGYLVTTAVTAPVYGRLGDAFGRRRMMMVALSVTTIGSLLCAFSVSLEMLIVSRLIQGMGGGGLLSLSQALIGQSVPPRDRAKYQGYIATVAVTASTIGPVVGGFLTEHLGWRSIFFFNLPILLLAMALVMRLPARTTPFEHFRFDFPGLLLLAIFVSSLLIAVEQVQDLSRLDVPLTIVLTILVILSVVLLILRERRASNPLIPLPLMRNPAIWRANATAFLYGGVMVAMLSFIPIYLRIVRGASAAEIGLLLLPMTASIGIGSTIVGQFVARTGRTRIFPVIGLTVLTAMMLFLAFGADRLSTIEFSWYLCVCAIFQGFVMAVMQIVVQVESGPLLGTAAAIMQLSRSVGAAFGTAVVGTVLFAGILATGTDLSSDLQAVLQGSEEALTQLSADAEATIRANVATAFHGVFLAIAVMGAMAGVVAWTIPRRSI